MNLYYWFVVVGWIVLGVGAGMLIVDVFIWHVRWRQRRRSRQGRS